MSKAHVPSMYCVWVMNNSVGANAMATFCPRDFKRACVKGKGYTYKLLHKLEQTHLLLQHICRPSERTACRLTAPAAEEAQDTREWSSSDIPQCRLICGGLKGTYHEKLPFSVLVHIHLGIWSGYQPTTEIRQLSQFFVAFFDLAPLPTSHPGSLEYITHGLRTTFFTKGAPYFPHKPIRADWAFSGGELTETGAKMERFRQRVNTCTVYSDRQYEKIVFFEHKSM